MEDTPDSLPQADAEGAPAVGFGSGNRVLAGVMLVGCLLLAYVCTDVVADGRLTRALSAGPDTPEGDL